MAEIHDPLRINLKKQTQELLNQLPPTSPHVITLHNAKTHSELLTALSNILYLRAFTVAVTTLFRPILLDLCSRWLLDSHDREDKLEAFAVLLEVHTELYPVLSAFLRQPDFKGGPLASITAAQDIPAFDTHRLQRILLAYYRILQTNRELPSLLSWSLTPLSLLMWTPHPDAGVRYLAIRCYALQSGMGEGQRVQAEHEILGEAAHVDCPLHYGQNFDGTPVFLDGWLLPLVDAERVAKLRQSLLDPQNYYSSEDDSSIEPIHPAELSPYIVNIHGILMFCESGARELDSTLIATPSAVEALRTLATHLSLGIPTLLTSPPSSGKSLLLSHLASYLYPTVKNKIITIHLADTSLDPRSLLGSYVSSTTQSGTFEWKEGVLVRAMREGRWVVFEDIDRGSTDVLGLIKPLVEVMAVDGWVGGRAVLEVPSRGKVVAHESFAIFSTRSLSQSPNGNYPPLTFFGAHKFHEMEVASPNHQELRLIIDARFPRLAGSASEGLIRLWEDVRALGSASSVRGVGLRELEKICRRVDGLLPANWQSMDIDITEDSSPMLLPVFSNVSIREDILFEIQDCLFAAGATTTSARAHMDAMAAVVADHLDLTPERRDWVLTAKNAEFQQEKDVNGGIVSIRFGHTRLHASPAAAGFNLPPTKSFAMHKPATLLMSRIATAVSLNEPLLLTGETGTGKTSVVTHLASLLRKPLISLNLSHQTESSDILGGFKPIDARVPASELQETFLALFSGTFSRKRNAKFDESVRKAVLESKWKRAVALWIEAVRMAKERILARNAEDLTQPIAQDNEGPRKRRKTEQAVSLSAWEEFERDVRTFEVQHIQGNGKFAFGFVEGPLVKALRFGHWILLDEINLASGETLECISSLLHGPTASITLTEQGSLEPVVRHPDFRLFACMNPATDVGKKDLPPNIRSRFTEIDVPPPDADKETLLSIVSHYIGPYAVGDKGAVMDVAEFYTAVRKHAEKREIADGSNHRPHFSMRTLARALTFAADMASTHSLRRALWEGCLMAFTMVLDEPSTGIVTTLAQKHVLAGVRNPRSLLAKEPSPPQGRSVDDFVKFGPFYLERGPLPEDAMDEYIMTPSVETKLIDLARIIATRRFPVLIEGPTSSGKTSSIEYLARRTGHHFVRINNHEHTDIQEYLGTYVSDSATGKLVFKDGLLVRALRNGDWIVLDELNLAPTDVLEALNRLLDDNRELVIPETQEVVRPHPHFLLFATQNPSGLYGGRKVLSRAFRNRFLEVHFDDVPQAELETILCRRCKIAPSYAQRIVTVFQELQRRRQSSRIFESKHGFATLRDLFRWAGRDAIDYQELAENGFMLLAERARKAEDKAVAKDVIESVMKVKIDESRLYELHSVTRDSSTYLGCPVPESSQLVWTSGMQRLFTLVARALRFHEPVLLVGDTGCGKTSVCQLYAEVLSRRLHAVNCHQNTETADLIGGLRPLRNRTTLESDIASEAQVVLQECGVSDYIADTKALASTVDTLLRSSDMDGVLQSKLKDVRSKLRGLSTMFQWYDGPLIDAMRNGEIFLLDEISLADDSVLERLNSVLEPSRTIVLAERGDDGLSLPTVKADGKFELVATMNPGGDYGKKELSPALRNRFTEIWVPAVDDRRDMEQIVRSLWKHDALQACTDPLLDFGDWLGQRISDKSIVGLRDILAWVEFSNAVYGGVDGLSVAETFHHAAHMTFLDGLGSLPQLSAYSASAIEKLRQDASTTLNQLFAVTDSSSESSPQDPAKSVQLGPFAVPRGLKTAQPNLFSFQAPTTRDNVSRVVRACQLSKPVLLEGSPGVGKTSLIAALANICGYDLCRINLSDQTDLVDLFGSDLPVEGGGPGQFAWKDAEFLRAMQEGHWVLLDEMNLAPQAILEGLNAVLDHRGTVYIPELGRSFTRHPSFRIFAAQNPLYQGGGRKGLPKSFLNRFTKVYVQELSSEDVLIVCRGLFPTVSEDLLHCMITYTTRLQEEVMVKRTFGREGSPWEFNLRDVIRWASLVQKSNGPPGQFLHAIFLQRFRTSSDREQAKLMFQSMFPDFTRGVDAPTRFTITPSFVQFGLSYNTRQGYVSGHRPGHLLHSHLPALESLGMGITHGWLSILTGPHNSGKSSLVRTLATLTGNSLHEIHVNSATDASDILGSFEEVDLRSQVNRLADQVSLRISSRLASTPGSKVYTLSDFSLLWETVALGSDSDVHSLLKATLQLLQMLPAEDTIDLQHSATALSAAASTSLAGKFEWVDGPLVQAIRSGHWVLLDGANLCNPSVLDRLNSLCEGDGQLTLNERGAVNGQVQVLKPHPDFRLFMTVDSRFGELSRAMRNRGIEIALLPPTADDYESLTSYMRLPTTVRADVPQSVVFHAQLRKGILQRSSSHQAPIFSLSTQLWGEDSACAAVSELLPELYQQQAAKLPLQHFVSQSTPCQHLHLLRRLMSHLGAGHEYAYSLGAFLDGLLHTKSFAFGQAIRLSSHMSHGIPMELLHAQPMDVMMYRFAPSASVEELVSTTNVLMLRLTSTLQFFEMVLLEDGVMKSQVHKAVVDAVIVACRSVYEAAQQLRDNTPSADEQTRTSLRLVLHMLGYTRYMQGVTSADVLDYSALQAASSWFATAFRDSSHALEGIQSTIHALNNVISLRSGLGISRLWLALSKGIRCESPDAEESSLENAASGLSAERRSNILNLMALRLLPVHLAGVDEQRALYVLTERVHIQLSEHMASDAPLAHNVEPYTHVAELGLLGAISGVDDAPISEIVAQRLQQRLHLACNDSRTPLRQLAPYMCLLWLSSAGKEKSSVVTKLYRSWLEILWNASITEEISGPSLLCIPTQLFGIVLLSDWTDQALSMMGAYEAALRQRSALILSQAGCSTRAVQLVRMLSQSLLLVLSPFRDGLDTDAWEVIRALPQKFESTWQDWVQQLCSCLNEVDYDYVSQAFQRTLQPFLLRLCKYRLDDRKAWPLLGQCFVNLSHFITALFIPDRPIDPAAIEKCTYEFQEQQRGLLSEQIDMHARLEKRTSGQSSNDTIAFLESELQLATHLIPPSASHTPRRAVARLHSYWAEIDQLFKLVLAPNKLDAFAANTSPFDSSMVQRERVIQESIAAFCQRLDTVYPEFGDLSHPIQLSLQFMKVGLRLVVQSSPSHRKPMDDHIVHALTAFPSVRSAEALQLSQAPQDILPKTFEVLLAQISAVAFEASVGVDVASRIRPLSVLYERALGLWLVERAREVEHEREAQSLYKSQVSSSEGMNDAELEEEEFRALFPDYEDVLNEEGLSGSTRIKRLIDPALVIKLVQINEHLFSPQKAHTSQSPHVLFTTFKNTLLRETIEEQINDWSEGLDLDSLPLQVSLLHERLANFSSPPLVTSGPRDFYVDANVHEARKFISILVAFADRLRELIVEWPDQMVLQHLKARCDAAMQLNLHSPVAKFLAALEQLLVQSEDWEDFANRSNTIKPHQQVFTSLIVEWRRLELSAWQDLLEIQARRFAEGLSDWWFRLYEVSIHGLLKAVQEDEGDDGVIVAYLDTLVPLLEDYLTSGPLGQFTLRLRLLLSFQVYASFLSKQASAEEASALRRVCRIMHSVSGYYGQFEARVAASLAEQRAALEKDVRSFIKIASWRDINVQALKQSAQKTHHQLYKSIRKFRDMLRQPVTSLLQLTADSSSNEDHVAVIRQITLSTAFPESPAGVSGPSHLVNLPATFSKFITFIGRDLKSFVESRTPHFAEALASDIVSTAKSLSESGITAGSDSERRTKLLKNLLQRKRKAWSDMLKELKRAGLPANVKPDVLVRQQSNRWLREQPNLQNLDQSRSLGKVDHYWYRLMGLLPILRASISNHHSDISTRELQRGALFVESCFSAAVMTRARLSNVHVSLDQLRRLATRLRQISRHPEIRLSGPSTMHMATFVSESSCKLVNSLQEVDQHLQILLDLPGKIDIPDSLVASIRAEIAALRGRQGSISEILSNVALTDCPVLLEHEYGILAEDLAHLKDIKDKLLEWSGQFPHLRQILLPVHQWLSSRTPPDAPRVSVEVTHQGGHAVIDALLLSVQSLLSLRPDPPPTALDEDEPPDDYIKEGWTIALKVSSSLNLTLLVDKCSSLLQDMSRRPPDNVAADVSRVLPFLDNFVMLADTQVDILAQWTKSLLKLDYVLCSIVQSIAKDGFCQPKEMEEDADAKDGGETMEGTGLGEGNGGENVSKEIQDESQVEGLQGETGAEDDVERAEEDNAVEMAEDFGGEMQDVPEGEDSEEEDKDGESDEELDDQIGDLDANDEAVVDEKLWGDEKGPEDKNDKKQSDKDNSTQTDGQDDVVAKENDQGQEKGKEKEPQSDAPEGEPEQELQEENNAEDEMKDEHEDAGNDGAPLDEYLQNAETLDLPDDLEMDGKEQEDDVKVDEDEDEDAMSSIEEPEDDTISGHPPEDVEEDADDVNGKDGDQIAPGELDQDDPEHDLEKEAAEPDTSAGDGFDNAATNVQSDDTNTPAAKDHAGSKGRTTGSAQGTSEAVEDNQAEPESAEPQPMSTDTDEATAASAQPDASDATTGQAQQSSGQGSSQPQPQQLENNPVRSLGDALKEITRRFDDILQSETPRADVQKMTDTGGDSQMEYLREDEADEMQALGPAGLENSAKLDELKFTVEEEPSKTEGASAMDIEETSEPAASAEVELSSLNAESSSSNSREGVESALTQSDVQKLKSNSVSAAEAVEGIPSAEISSRSEHDNSNLLVERQLREWQASGQPSEQAEHIWRLYESLTHDLSYALCEQLRLILEPTQATRLKGDYRTGKRLNMKKIIPYIASEYTKDKIWLRRTRPSQREYQVLVALDDSRSMAESHSVHLAYQTLALVSKALSRLEVGDIAIAKFGEGVEVLHGFDKGPFTDQAGTAVLDAFKFDQKATQVLSLVDTSLQLLERAREQRSTKSSSSAGDLWQMEIIISDGICQDHERLATVLRKAEEQRVMVVFIILDSLHSKDTIGAQAPSGATPVSAVQNSILSMNQVAYKEVNGKMDLTVSRYLDTFPFEYYVVVRDVEALPDVLAGTLKQFFERIAED